MRCSTAIFLAALLHSADDHLRAALAPHTHTRGETLMSAENYIGSNDFWNTVVTVLATVFVAILAAWATLRSVNPKRRLIWRQHVNASLLRGVDGATAIGVSHGQNQLAEPRLVELLIKNSGRRDVQSSDFASVNDSLVFDLSVPVVSVLDARAKPPTAGIPVTSHTGTELRIHPRLIAKGHMLQLSILVDGAERDVDLKTATILETPVRRGRQGDFETTSRRLFRMGQMALPVLVAVTVIIVTIGVVNALNSASRQLERDTKILKEGTETLKDAGDVMTLLRKCRYWDVHDPERAKKECPDVVMPTQDNE